MVMVVQGVSDQDNLAISDVSSADVTIWQAVMGVSRRHDIRVLSDRGSCTVQHLTPQTLTITTTPPNPGYRGHTYAYIYTNDKDKTIKDCHVP